MNDVGLHSFLGESANSMLEIIFPTADRKMLTYDQIKEVVVFEESEGHEMTAQMFFQYLHDLAEYKKGNRLSVMERFIKLYDVLVCHVF
jgi:hypothetical protein